MNVYSVSIDAFSRQGISCRINLVKLNCCLQCILHLNNMTILWVYQDFQWGEKKLWMPLRINWIVKTGCYTPEKSWTERVCYNNTVIMFPQSTVLHILLTKYKNITKLFLFQGKIYEDDGLVSIWPGW